MRPPAPIKQTEIMRHILRRGARFARLARQMNVEWNSKESRFQSEVDGQLAIADCLVRPGEWIVTHVEVPVALRGGGIASKLAAGIVEHARSEKRVIVPMCPFMAAYFERHPEARDVLSAE